MAIRKQEKLETPISSLIDVVFLLIIFFVVTAALDAEVMDTSLKLSQAKFSEPIKEIQKGTIFVNVRKGRITMGLGRAVSLRELQLSLKAEAAAYKKKYARSEDDKLPVVIRVEGSVPYGEVDKITAAISDAERGPGIYKLSLSAYAEKK